MFNPSRDEVRSFFTETLRKQREGAILTPLEAIAADWIVEHPEYHAELADGEAASAQDYSPERGQSNPFLHLSMQRQGRILRRRATRRRAAPGRA